MKLITLLTVLLLEYQQQRSCFLSEKDPEPHARGVFFQQPRQLSSSKEESHPPEPPGDKQHPELPPLLAGKHAPLARRRFQQGRRQHSCRMSRQHGAPCSGTTFPSASAAHAGHTAWGTVPTAEHANTSLTGTATPAFWEHFTALLLSKGAHLPGAPLARGCVSPRA